MILGNLAFIFAESLVSTLGVGRCDGWLSKVAGVLSCATACVDVLSNSEEKLFEGTIRGVALNAFAIGAFFAACR